MSKIGISAIAQKMVERGQALTYRDALSQLASRPRRKRKPKTEPPKEAPRFERPEWWDR